MTVAKPGKIITFYSYKGGTGRSMALANIAWILASNSKRVLVVDWDLEAPGLQRYFRPFLVDRELTSSPGVVDLISDFILEAITPLEKGEKLAPDWFLPKTDIDPYVISLNWKFSPPGQLDFIPAGRQGPDYGQRFSAINWQKFYDVLGGGAFIEQLKINMRSQYDYILVDSRTGVSDTSGICTIQLPDTLVVCFTLNNQSIEGAASITQGVFDQRTAQDSISSLVFSGEQAQSVADGFYLSPHRFKIFPVPMRVDQSERDKLEIRRSYARRKFDPFLDDRKRILDRQSYWGAVAVPYIPYFSYEEILAVFKDNPRDPNTTLAAFTRIAAEITDGEVTGFVALISPESREAILQDFAGVPELARATTATSDSEGTAGNVRFPVTTAFDKSTESPLEESLRRAESTVRSLNEEEREQARLLWLRLVRIPRPGENIENSKVRVPLKELNADSNSVIQRFANAGVITVSKDDRTGDPTVEVKDEELLRSWPTLDRWIVENRDLLLWRQDLRSSMAQWRERGGSVFDLLWGLRLWKAYRWFRTNSKYLSKDEVGYIEASLRWSRIVVLNVVIVVGSILLVTYYLLTKSDKTTMAASIASIAETQLASATAGSQLSPDQFQLGLLLAVEAQQVAANAKAESLLKTNLPRLPRKIGSVDAKNNVLDLALSPSGAQVLSITGLPRRSDQSLADSAIAQLNDLTTRETIIRVPLPREADRYDVSSDARYVAIAAAQGATTVEVREAATGKIVASLQPTRRVVDMGFTPDGSYFVVASDDKLVRIVNLREAGRGASPFEFTSAGAVIALTFSGDSQHLALVREDSVVQILQDISRPGLSERIEINVGTTSNVQVVLSHDGRYLATTMPDDSRVKLWDVKSESLVRVFEINAPETAARFTPDSAFLLAASDGTIHAWSLASESADRRIQYNRNNPVIMGASKYFGVAEANFVRIWEYDGSSFTEIAAVIHKSNLQSFLYGDPNFVVTATTDNLITVWKLGQPVTDNLQNEACSRLTRNLSMDEWNTHVANYLGAYRKTCSDLP